jgi:hypothetical protein
MRPPYHIFRIWILEVLAIVLAIGLIVAIGSILTVYDGKPVPDLGVNLSLNALLALLSTVLRALLVIVVAQIISQRKWDWYKITRARPLEDLQKFDAGSRGSLGALQLIPTVLLHDGVTLIAALILLSSFLVGPSVQQASRTAECYFTSLNSSGATIPTAHWVPRSGGYRWVAGNPYAVPMPDVVVAILSSVTSPGGVENQITPSCATGNCTFDDLPSSKSRQEALKESQISMHSAAAVCSVCTDVTSLVTRKINATTKVSQQFLPNGVNTTTESYISARIRPDEDLSWVGGLLTKDARAASRWAYVNATFLSGWGDIAIASVCSLYPCLRTYTTIVEEDQLQEKEVQSEVMQIEFNRLMAEGFDAVKSYNAGNNTYYNYTAVRSPCRINGSTLNATDTLSVDSNSTNLTLYDFTSSPPIARNISLPEQCIYRHDPGFVSAISQIMEGEIFDGYCTTYKGLTCTKTRTLSQSYDGEIPNLGVGTVLRTLCNDYGNNSFSNITRYFDNVATSLSNRFRVNYGSPIKPKNSTDVPPLDLVQGTAWQTKVCVEMRGAWLLLPICLTALTTLLSMWTIWTNWRHRHTRPIWHDNILPFLFYAHMFASQDHKTLTINKGQQDVEGEGERLMEASEMAAAARDVMIKVKWPEHGGSGLLEGQAHSSAVLLQQQSIPLRSRQERGMDDVSLH